MGFDQLDECAVGILDVTEAAGGIAHVERTGAVDCGGKTQSCCPGVNDVTAANIETDVDESQIAPETTFVDSSRRAPLIQDKVDLRGTKQAAEWSGIRRRSREAQPAKTVDGLIKDYPVIPERFTVKTDGAAHIGHPNDCADNAADNVAGACKWYSVLCDLKSIAVGILDDKMFDSGGIRHDGGEDVRAGVLKELKGPFAVVGLQAYRKDAPIAYRDRFRRRLRLTADELPDLKAAAARHIQRENRAAPLGLSN